MIFCMWISDAAAPDQIIRRNGSEFGVKITNTFPVDVKAGELQAKKCTCQVNPVSSVHFTGSKTVT